MFSKIIGSDFDFNPSDKDILEYRVLLQGFELSNFYERIGNKKKNDIEMFYLNNSLNFGIPPVLVFQFRQTDF